MRRDPSQKQESLVEVAALEYFTNREGAIEAFERYLNAPAGTDLRVLTFYGVGGIGKTTLINKLCDNLRQAKIPHARFDMQTIRDQTQAYREALLQMRCDLESQFGIPFPRFDLCLAVILAREGGEPPPLVQINPFLQDVFKFITSIFQAPREGLGGLIDASIRRLPQLEAYVRKVSQHARMSSICVTLPCATTRNCMKNSFVGSPKTSRRTCLPVRAKLVGACCFWTPMRRSGRGARYTRRRDACSTSGCATWRNIASAAGAAGYQRARPPNVGRRQPRLARLAGSASAGRAVGAGRAGVPVQVRRRFPA
jgi:hypothetical protein